MHVFEKVAELTSHASKGAKNAVAGNATFSIYIINASDVAIHFVGMPHAVSSTCLTSVPEVAPGSAAWVQVNGRLGGGVALELAVGEESLLVGCTLPTSSGSAKFALNFSLVKPALGAFYTSIREGFYGADPSLPDRAGGHRFAAFCSRGDAGTFCAAPGGLDKDGKLVESPTSAIVTVGLVQMMRQVPFQPTSAEPLPHFALMSLDSFQWQDYMDHVRETTPGLLPCAIFLFELAAVIRGVAWCELADRAFALDVLIEAFVSDGGRALGHEIADSFGVNLEKWFANRHPSIVEKDGLPCYSEYASFSKDRVPLSAHVDSATALLWAVAVECARRLGPITADWQGFDDFDSPIYRRPKIDSVEDFLAQSSSSEGDEPEAHVARPTIYVEHLCSKVSVSSRSPSRRRTDTESTVTATSDIPLLIRQSVGDSVRHTLFRRGVLAEIKEKVRTNDGKEALDHYIKWLPVELREFVRPANADSPGVRFRVYSPGLFASVDNGEMTNPDTLLSSMGEGSPSYQAMSTNSKSGEFFFFSGDRLFLIKSITDAEARLLHNMLPAYQDHLRTYPKSLLVRYAGMFHVAVDEKHGLSKFFTIMVSAFDPTHKIHETFDVKGSLYLRKKKVDESIGKDQDWFQSGRRVSLTGGVCREVLAAHEADCMFLMRFNVLDYSLLIGIHHLAPREPRGNGYREGGGFWAIGANEIYFMGLIDFLIGFTLKKKAEHTLRAVQGHAKDASCVDPETYAFRQVKFLRDSVFDTDGSCDGTLGVLRISNMSGRDLANMDGIFDVSDPYIVATIGLQRTQTTVVKNNLNPNWACELFLPINECHRAMKLFLNVIDEDSVAALRGADDPMGYVELSMDGILRSPPQMMRDVRLKDISTGTISFQLQFTPVR